jgi:hypothetical protein
MMSQYHNEEDIMTGNSRRRLMDRKIVEQLISGKGINAICRDLMVGKNRLSHVREKAREYGYLDGITPIPPFPEAIFPDPVDARSLRTSEADLHLQEQRPWIEDRLRAGWQPITIFEELPIHTGRSSFYRFLHRHRLAELGEAVRKSLVQEIVYAPGEALILDWGKLINVADPDSGRKRILWMFIGVLGCSRYMMVHLVWSYDVPTTLTTLEQMFRELGGVPKRIVSDNPKCFALEASKYDPLINPIYERFAAHYRTTIECLPPGAPELKGRVERMVPFGRRLYEAHGKGWYGIDESQQYMNKKVAIANQRIHGTTRQKPIDVFLQEEAAALKPLPAVAYEIEEFHEGIVRKDCHVRFRDKYYSVAEDYRNHKVAVIGDSRQVSIYHKGKLIEVHDRITLSNISKSTKECHKSPWQRSILEGSFYRKRAAKLGPYVEEIIVKLLLQGNGFIDTRKVWGILSLDKKYSAEDINEACRKALSVDAISYRSILTFLQLKATGQQDAKKEVPVANTKSSKFVRPIEEYQQLLIFGGKS